MTNWKIDTTHSEVKFKVKHLVISTVTGHFNQFEATIIGDPSDLPASIISFEADIHSIDTKNTQRDDHLKSPDFFDASNHPKIAFNSTAVVKKSASDYEVTGNLTIRGNTREVKLNAVYNGTVTGFGGVEVAAFEITGKINRQDFGLTWSALTEAGGVVVSDDVKLEIFAEFNRVPANENAKLEATTA
jgi:polyisoprenoid-binding protein YceI